LAHTTKQIAGRSWFVGDRIGDPFGKERRGIELEQVFLDHAAHEIGRVRRVNAVAESPLEPVPVEERHEQLEICLLAVVWRGGHQQKMPRDRREDLSELVSLGVFDLSAEIGCRHLVRLVAHDEIPPAIGHRQLRLDIFVAAKLVEAGDDKIVLREPVTRARRLQLVVGQDLEREMETTVKLVLPLFGKAARAHDKAPLKIAARNQLLDEQARHDRFARARIIGKQEPQRLARQHCLVNCGDLMRQRLDD
jgi:hypothetical protein